MPKVTGAYIEGRTDEILDAAERVLSEHGFERASMHQIAEAAELSVGTLYRYFADKDALVRSMCRRDLERGALARGATGGSPLGALVEAGKQALAHWQGGRARLAIEIWLAACADPEGLGSAEFEFRRELLASLEAGLDAAADAGEIGAGLDHGLLARLLVATVDGLRLQQLQPGADPDVGGVIDLLGRLLEASGE